MSHLSPFYRTVRQGQHKWNLCTIILELKVVTLIENYLAPVVNGGAEPQEGDVIARAWIVRSEGIPRYTHLGIPMPQRMALSA